jgi:Spy/CpxP family protein refolding chaperone
MKTWIKRTLIGLFGATVLFGSLAACSHRGHGWGAGPMTEEDATRFKAKMVDKVSDKLDLDAAQKAKLVVLADKLREQKLALMADTANPRAEAQALVSGATFDRARAQALVQAKTSAVNAKSPEVIAAAADFFDSLKPAQQQKVREFMASRHGGRWSRG